MARVFLNKQFSNYLGENRAINDIIVEYKSDAPVPTPSISPSNTTTPTQTPTTTPTQTPTTTPTQTPTQTQTQTQTPTQTQTQTQTQTPTNTSTNTPTPSITPSPTPNFNVEYTDIKNRAGALGYSLPSTTEQNQQNQLITNLKNAGIWSKLGIFYMLAVDSSVASPGFTFINWITPANSVSSLGVYSGVNYATHTSNSGWTFSQTNFMSLGVNPNLSSVNSLQVNLSGMSEGCYVAAKTGNSTSGTNNMWSTNNNSWNRALFNNSASQNMFRGNGLTTAYDFQGIGFKGFSINGRPDTDTSAIFTNNTIQTTKTKTAVDSGIAGGTMRLNGVASSESFSWTCSLFWSGRLNSTETATLNTIIDAYLS